MNTMILEVGMQRTGSRGHKRNAMRGVCAHGFSSRHTDCGR